MRKHTPSSRWRREAPSTNGIQKKRTAALFTLWIPAVKIDLWSIAGMTIMGCLFFAQAASAQDRAVVCNLLKQQQSLKSATYEPGVDAYGAAVVPADINATTSIPDIVEIPLEIDLAERLNGVNQDGLRLYTSFGTIKIRMDGQVMHGEEDVTDKVHDWCGTPIPEILDETQEDIKEPVLEEKPAEEVEVILEDKSNKEMEVIEVEAKTPILPQEINEAGEPPLPKEEILTGSDYRDYNE